MTNPFTWSTIMHFEDLADNGELSVKSSLQDHYRPASNIKLDYDYITSKPPPPPPPPPSLVIEFFFWKTKNVWHLPQGVSCLIIETRKSFKKTTISASKWLRLVSDQQQ